jgi:hypothetical protein
LIALTSVAPDAVTFCPAAGAATAGEIAVETESANVAASAAIPIRLVIETSLRSKTRIGISLASVRADTKKNGPA